MNMSLYQRVIHHRTYARNIGNRLETYEESVARYIDYLTTKFHDNEKVMVEMPKIQDYFNDLKAVGSMRLFFSAGQAVESENAMAFNCKYQAIHELKSFADLLYSLLCTCGVGISVRHEHISRLPKLPKKIRCSDTEIVVEDSRTGWAVALLQYLNCVFYLGISKKFDTSKVREQGAPLLTSGGYASGAEPFIELRNFIEKIILNAVGRKLLSTECFDIACMIANCAVQGGVRRAAIITLFDDYDNEMMHIKDPHLLKDNQHRYNSNNTMVWYGDEKYLKLAWDCIRKNGEPGILFYKNLIKKVEETGRKDDGLGFGVNPCSEIILLSDEYCNLSEVILRPEHSLKDDLHKVRTATILNLMQATLTDYHFVSTRNKYNQENDPILGVSLTGVCDCPLYVDEVHGEARIEALKDVCDNTVEEFWECIGLKRKPLANTCIKPSGTVSKIVNSSSGLHPRFAKYYRSSIIIGQESSLYKSLEESNIPFIEPFKDNKSRVYSFCIKSPEQSLCVEDVSAIRQLKLVDMLNRKWCDHNSSVTVYVKNNEWNEIYEIIKNSNEFVSLSFLSYEANYEASGYLYMPLEKITKGEFEKYDKIQKDVDFDKVFGKEDKDNEVKAFACSGGSCSF